MTHKNSLKAVTLRLQFIAGKDTEQHQQGRRSIRGSLGKDPPPIPTVELGQCTSQNRWMTNDEHGAAPREGH